MKVYKIWRTYSWVYSEHNCSCILNEACIIPLPEAETFYFNDVLQNWNSDSYSNGGIWTVRLLLHDASISQRRRRLSACVYRAQWLTVDIFSTFYGVFMVYCPKLMLSKFLHLWFLPRDAMHKRGLCRHVVPVCLSVCVCVSVCLSVCLSVCHICELCQNE